MIQRDAAVEVRLLQLVKGDDERVECEAGPNQRKRCPAIVFLSFSRSQREKDVTFLFVALLLAEEGVNPVPTVDRIGSTKVEVK